MREGGREGGREREWVHRAKLRVRETHLNMGKYPYCCSHLLGIVVESNVSVVEADGFDLAHHQLRNVGGKLDQKLQLDRDALI